MTFSQSSFRRLDLQKTTTQRNGAKSNKSNPSWHRNLLKSFSCQTIITLAAALLVFSVEVVIGNEFANEWAVEVPEGDVAAELLAKEHGFINLGRVRFIYNISIYIYYD